MCREGEGSMLVGRERKVSWCREGEESILVGREKKAYWWGGILVKRGGSIVV